VDTFGLDPLRLDEQALSKAVLYFALGHSVNTVPSYLAAIQKVYTLSGAGDLPRSPVFKMFQAGVRRLFGAADEVVQIKAIQFAEMVTILDSLSWDDPADVCFGAQMLTAFFLALRTEDHTGGRLRWGDAGGRRFPSGGLRPVQVGPRQKHEIFSQGGHSSKI
jgi:hypothetical protein